MSTGLWGGEPKNAEWSPGLCKKLGNSEGAPLNRYDLSFQDPALSEANDSLGGDRDRLSGFGIPARSCRSGSDAENAEVPELDGIPGGQSLLHGRQEEVDHLPGLFFLPLRQNRWVEN